MLELVDRFRVEEVGLTLSAPLVLAAELELAVGTLFGALRIGRPVAGRHLAGQFVEPDAAELADRAGEVLVDERLAEADRLEDLRPGVGRHGRDAHLRHHLEHALVARLDVVADRLVGVQVAHAVHAFGDQVLDRLERQVRVDRSGAVADEQRHVMHFAGIAGLDDQAGHRALLGPHEVVVHRSGQQQRRDRRVDRVGVAVGEHDQTCAVLDRT